MVLELSGEAKETYRSVVSRLVESHSNELGLITSMQGDLPTGTEQDSSKVLKCNCVCAYTKVQRYSDLLGHPQLNVCPG